MTWDDDAGAGLGDGGVDGLAALQELPPLPQLPCALGLLLAFLPLSPLPEVLWQLGSALARGDPRHPPPSP